MLAAALISLSMAGLAPVVPAGSFIPEPKDFRIQEIRRAKGEIDWPFVAEKGMLACAPSWKDKLVYFIAENKDGKQEFPFALPDNMMLLAMLNVGRASALRPYDNFEQLYKRLFPYIAIGKRLCDQPAGAKLPESAL